MFCTVDSCHKCNWQNQKLNPGDNHLSQGTPREKPQTKLGVCIYWPPLNSHLVTNLIYGFYSSGPVKNMHIYFGSGSNSTDWIPSFWAHIWLVLVQFLKWPLMQLLFKKSSCWMSEWARLPYHSTTTLLWACMIWCEPACMASPLMMHRLEFVSKNTRTKHFQLNYIPRVHSEANCRRIPVWW